jgi:hypothetical protein
MKCPHNIKLQSIRLGGEEGGGGHQQLFAPIITNIYFTYKILYIYVPMKAVILWYSHNWCQPLIR